MGESDEDFVALGDEFVEALTTHAGLRQDARVLDIGCGYGRLPHALKRSGFAGTYLGIDVLEKHVRWCHKRLGEPRFRFLHADIKNERYNPNGSLSVGDLDLGDERFDVIAAFSVFTHMWPEDVDAYLRLASRALAPDGRLAATFFVLDHVWHQLEVEDRVALKMPFEREPGCRYESEAEPLHRVAYEGRWVVFHAADAGLVPVGPPVYGTWSWRPIEPEANPGYQDLLVFRLPRRGRARADALAELGVPTPNPESAQPAPARR